MIIRRATKNEDFLAISNLYQQGWQTAYAGIVPPSYLQQIKADRWVPYLKNDYPQMFLVELKQQILGVATYGAGRDKDWQEWGELKSIYLKPLFKNQGYGSQLLRTTLAELEKEYTKVYLWVLADNWPSRYFYEKHGFKLAAETLQIEIAGKSLTEVRYVRYF